MAILSKGTDFTTGDQVTAAKLDALVDSATFASGAVDDSTTQLDGSGRIIVKDGGITTAKLNLTANVGIGTSSPSNILHVSGTSATPLKLERTGGSAQNINILFEDGNTDWYAGKAGAAGFGVGNAANLTSSAKFLIDDNGRVGIGTTSPEATLHVVDQGSTQPCILVQNASSSEGDIAVIDGESLQMGHWSGSAFTQRMTFASDGDLTIGASTVGGVQINPLADDGAATIIFNRADTSNNSVVLKFQNNASTVGQIFHNNSATTYSTSSDYRLKEDVIDMQDSISRVQALKPVNFAWKIDGRRVDGFLAHEAQEVVPEAVIGDKDAVDEDGQPDYQGIDQSKLVPLLTKALQEALTKIESLEARVAALES